MKKHKDLAEAISEKVSSAMIDALLPQEGIELDDDMAMRLAFIEGMAVAEQETQKPRWRRIVRKATGSGDYSLPSSMDFAIAAFLSVTGLKESCSVNSKAVAWMSGAMAAAVLIEHISALSQLNETVIWSTEQAKSLATQARKGAKEIRQQERSWRAIKALN